MIRLRHFSLLTLFGTALALQGCMNSDDSPLSDSGAASATEEEAIQVVAFEEEGDLTDTEVRFFDDEAGFALAPINTHAWKRQVLDRSRTIDISIEQPGDAPATADVTITSEVSGLLHLAVCETDELVRLTKEFSDTGVRSLFFERVRPGTDLRHRGWKLQAISGMLIESPGTTREIRSVRVQAGDVDETITNVTDLVRVGNLLTLPSGSEVVVTVDTGDATDAVFLHRRHARHRAELENNGDGTFTGKFNVANAQRGFRHLAIDVLSDGTLYDDEERYDNVVWGIPFFVRLPSPDAAE
ncbi:MAG: hypothetical protein DHS20C21_09360 [Gemmatimonadota bacterium]|nr:MAG: hypothetical protein DHS20C21_09360 [Gemmatimonadota bacterium]